MVEGRFPYGPVLLFSETTGDNPSFGEGAKPDVCSLETTAFAKSALLKGDLGTLLRSIPKYPLFYSKPLLVHWGCSLQENWIKSNTKKLQQKSYCRLLPYPFLPRYPVPTRVPFLCWFFRLIVLSWLVQEQHVDGCGGVRHRYLGQQQPSWLVSGVEEPAGRDPTRRQLQGPQPSQGERHEYCGDHAGAERPTPLGL